MKKTVKSLIIAASVAAIAGIGAVSFAAWQGGTVSDQTAPGASGAIITDAGTISLSQNLVTEGDNLVKLVPYDQVAQYDSTTMAKMQTITLTYIQGTGSASSNYDFTMALTKNDDSLRLYYKLGTATVPTAEDVTTEGWTAFTLNEDVDLTLNSDTATINVILVSTSTGDMNKDYEITFSATEITTEA